MTREEVVKAWEAVEEARQRALADPHNPENQGYWKFCAAACTWNETVSDVEVEAVKKMYGV